MKTFVIFKSVHMLRSIAGHALESIGEIRFKRKDFQIAIFQKPTKLRKVLSARCPYRIQTGSNDSKEIRLDCDFRIDMLVENRLITALRLWIVITAPSLSASVRNRKDSWRGHRPQPNL